MSQWTQVAGAIRIDALVVHPSDEVSAIDITDNDVESDIQRSLGKDESEYYEDIDHRYTPKGSEGHLKYQYLIINKSDTSCIDRGTIVIHGSLRDYGGGDNTPYTEIIDWLNELANKNNRFTIRQGIVEISVSNDDTHIIRYDEKSGKFVEVH
jgi:hypothetical protein